MFIIKYGGQNDKIFLKFSNYLRYFQFLFSKIWGGGGEAPPQSFNSYVTAKWINPNSLSGPTPLNLGLSGPG